MLMMKCCTIKNERGSNKLETDETGRPTRFIYVEKGLTRI